MIIIPIILIALLIVGTFVFVLYPLIEAKEENWSFSKVSTTTQTVDELSARRDAIYAALKDAEFDRETGKFAEEDYQIVRARYMKEAAQVLRQIDRLAPEAEAALDAEIERDVAELRSDGEDGYSVDLVESVEADVAALIKRTAGTDEHALACPDCGQPYQPGDVFCAACGASLADTCPQCGTPHQADDAFCSRCGTPLAEGIGSIE